MQGLNLKSFAAESASHATSKATTFQRSVHKAAQSAEGLNTINLEYTHEEQPVSWLPGFALPWAKSSLELKAESVLNPSGYSVDTYHPGQRVAIERRMGRHIFLLAKTDLWSLTGWPQQSPGKLTGGPP